MADSRCILCKFAIPDANHCDEQWMCKKANQITSYSRWSCSLIEKTSNIFPTKISIEYYYNTHSQKKRECIFCEYKVTDNYSHYCKITKGQINLDGGCNYESKARK